MNAATQEVLDSYVAQNWAFVAIKLTPSEKRNYENEFLPPLTIKYQHDQLIFPLRISSVSTTQTTKITLYVIAESTVSSSNFPTSILQDKGSSYLVAPEISIEASILGSIGSEDRALVVMLSGRFSTDSKHARILYDLMKTSFPESKTCYLTRLETRIDPEAMTEDIRFVLDRGRMSSMPASTADPESPSAVSYGVTPLMYAAIDNRRPEMITALLKAGADVNVQDKDGYTALAHALSYRKEIVDLLEKNGAEP